jgi:hypothetical protein
VHVHLPDLRRAIQEHRRVRHQRRRDRAREMRRAPRGRRKRVEDREGRGACGRDIGDGGVLQSEPVRGGGLGEREVVPGVEERGERGFLARLGHDGREDADGDWRVCCEWSGVCVGVELVHIPSGWLDIRCSIGVLWDVRRWVDEQDLGRLGSTRLIICKCPRCCEF